MKNQQLTKLILCWLLLLTAVLFLGWTNTLKTNTPAGTDDPREADDRMREIKAAFVERLDADHYFTASSTSTYDHADTGKHEFITLIDMASNPSQASGYAHIYMKGDELFYQDDTDTTCQLTKDGFIEWESINDVNNATWVKSVDSAGTGTVNLIKGDANDLAVLPDGTETATNAAPGCSKGVTNKKYVDDQILSNVGMVQVVNTQTGSIVSGTTTIPYDNTKPQKTEGVECMTLAITPTSATNKLKIDVVCFIGHSYTGGGGAVTAALFQDSGADAIAAMTHRDGYNRPRQVVFTHYMTAGTTSETTFKVRCGCNIGGTTYLNGNSDAGGIFNGVMASSITITEINP